MTEITLVLPTLLALGVVCLIHLIVDFRRHRRPAASRALVLGSSPLVVKLVGELESSPDRLSQIVGVLDNESEPGADRAGIPWLGRLDQLCEIAERVRATRIVVALPERRGQLPLQALLESRVRGTIVEDAPAFYERLTGKVAIEALTPSALIHSNGFRNHGAAERLARAFSIAAAVAGLILLAPLLLVIALAIRLDSAGPVLFVQNRSGKDGRPFPLLKFRTMRPCDGEHSEWVRDNSDRITRIGKWLRRFRLDELPQLVNILRGEMNLIGPRPHPTCNQQAFMEQIAYYGLRSAVRPGVTGWAQVRYGYANNLEEETEKMRYDLYYIKNRSLPLDLKILFETVGIMLMGRGASEVQPMESIHARPVAVLALSQTDPVPPSIPAVPTES
jgi:exopolysaccharide biosynthesis polyprenyl glycosylphosphotransferase